MAGSRSHSIQETSRLENEARALGFKWDNPQQILDCISSEIEEVHEVFTQEAAHPGRIEEEIGDAFMGIISFCTFMQLDPEQVLQKANEKFSRRFKRLKQLMHDLKLNDLHNLTLEQKLRLWEEAKKL